LEALPFPFLRRQFFTFFNLCRAKRSLAVEMPSANLQANETRARWLRLRYLSRFVPAQTPRFAFARESPSSCKLRHFLAASKKVTDKMQGFAGVKQIINWLNLFLNFFVCRMQT
jgi:hypothetical protein